MTNKQESAISQHGKNLLAIFPNAIERDPVALCRRLRRLECQARAFALRLCNGPEFQSEEAEDAIETAILARVAKLLKPAGVPIFLNRDPRGYALKIDSHFMPSRSMPRGDRPYRPLRQDWGGYGILAPDIDKNGE